MQSLLLKLITIWKALTKGISYLKGPQLKVIHTEKYIIILSIQLLNYAYILLKQGFIKMNRLLDNIPTVNCEPSGPELWFTRFY